MNVDYLNAALAGRYRIECVLGVGGMATVYLAHDLKHQREVAIKVIKPHLAAAVGGAAVSQGNSGHRQSAASAHSGPV